MEQPTRHTLASRVAALRAKEGLSQDELARMGGVSQRFVFDMEHGHMPTRRTFEKFLTAIARELSFSESERRAWFGAAGFAVVEQNAHATVARELQDISKRIASLARFVAELQETVEAIPQEDKEADRERDRELVTG